MSKKFDVEEVLYLSNDIAMLLLNWLYRNDSAEVTGNYLKLHDLYHKIDGDTLKEVYENLEKVLKAPKDKQDLYALFYFPCLYTVDEWISNVEMFSKYYYHDLEYLYEHIGNLLKADNVEHPYRRLFLYNISW